MSGHDGNFQKNLPTEFVDLAFPKATCKSYPSAPLATHGSGIGYLKDRTNPLICGGLYGYELMSSCYKLDVMTGEYTLDRTLFHPRVYSGPLLAFAGLQMFDFQFILIKLESIWYFLGGYPLGSNASRTTEFFDDSGEHEGILGPDLPMPRRSHCSVFADPGDDFWIIGGRVGDYENANYSGLMTDGNVKL